MFCRNNNNNVIILTVSELCELWKKCLKKMSVTASSKPQVTTRSQTPTLVDIDSKLDQISATLCLQMANVKADLSSQIKSSAIEFNEKIKSLDSKIDNVTSKVFSEVDALRKECELMVSGVPYNAGENLRAIFKGLSSNFGYTDDVKMVVSHTDDILLLPNIELFRLKSNSCYTSTFIIKFDSSYNKNVYFQRYLKVCKSLKLSNIPGIAGNSRVYVQHNLTKEYYKVHKLALSLKKEKAISSIRIQHGQVAVKFTSDDKYIVYYSPDELQSALELRR